MSNLHFISYSAVDGFDFALRLCDELQIGPPSIEAWLDKRRLQANADWDSRLATAILPSKGVQMCSEISNPADIDIAQND